MSLIPATSKTTAAVPSQPASDSDEAVCLGLPLSSWIRIGSVAALFVLLFWKASLQRLWLKTNPITGEENWRHAPLVPLIGLYYLYVNREQLRPSYVTPTWSGLWIMISGILLFAYAIWPLQNDWVKDLGMVVTLFGVVTLMCGWKIMKTAWFPIAFLICALPWPGLFYSLLAGPLQKMAAIVAVTLLNLFGVHSEQSGTKIFVLGVDNLMHTLNVAEACAGLKSLMTFVTIAGAVAFLSYRSLWQKFVMVFSAIPIAIFCNTMRVTVQGVLARYFSMQWAESFAHGLVGLVMMIPAFFLILFVGWVLQTLFVEEVADKRALKEGYIAIAPRPRSSGPTPRRAMPRSGMQRARTTPPDKMPPGNRPSAEPNP